ncbi:hypothetical protein EJ02DRAFT_337380 [Clathrospora elynae]|uniref:Uncharacterized protein n=1 Tax=Clathrospora elynae TaxID=706981 RepID=A0A6A5T138_9PLEO|nr:hypothetical protein EJ02DRAFT_337380 [Clathrospora elynae]
MPRLVTARNAVIFINILVLTALFVHLKNELWGGNVPAAGTTGLAHLPDEIFDDHQTDAASHTLNDKPLKANWGIKARRTAVVVASQHSENAMWLHKYFPQWEKNIYSVDDPNAALTVPKNKGRESMVYLTYIIDHYESLADNVLFIHPNRYQWHNDNYDYDGLVMLRSFQLDYLVKEKYVNMRCAWNLGCPNEIKPFDNEGEHREAVHAGGDYKKAFQMLFPGTEVPREVGVSCCAQFAATKEKIRERKKEDYIRYRDWLLETKLGDDISGRIMEYSWHMIFGKPAVHCPRAEDCYCNVFGLCNLTCNDQGSCEGQYILPPFSSLPKGWPYIGWDKEPRERAIPEE